MSQGGNSIQKRTKITADWETVVTYFNHSDELNHINQLATAAGINKPEWLPFQDVEPLVQDTGERFFSAYLTWLNTTKLKHDPNDLCLCQRCLPNRVQPPPPQQKQLVPAIDPSPPEQQVARRNQWEEDSWPSNVLVRVTAPTTVAREVTPSPRPQTLPPTPRLLLPQHTNWMYPFAFPHTASLVFAQTTPFFCCEKYRGQYFRNDKRGRPPHNHWCPTSTKNNNNVI